jgi:hypothetical protein
VRSLAIAALVVAGCGAAHRSEPSGPSLRLRLPDLDGGFIDFADLRGKPLVVHVFTIWAMPAADDAERLRTLDADRIAVVGVALDRTRANVVRAWRRAMEVRYRIALADDVVRAGRSTLGPARQVPITLLYDSGGRLLRRWDGPLGDSGIARIRDLADSSRRLR